jgi:L-amino acid N-acyltransferase YncA
VIRPCTPADTAQICEIYNHYVEHTIVTFEELPVTTAEMERRIREVTMQWPWLVCEEGGSVVGYAYAGPWKARSAYRFAVESTVYLAVGQQGRGLGAALYRRLIDELARCGAHCVIGGVSLPNAASVALHEKLGFRKIGQFCEVGWKLGHWVDVGYWELML